MRVAEKLDWKGLRPVLMWTSPLSSRTACQHIPWTHSTTHLCLLHNIVITRYHDIRHRNAVSYVLPASHYQPHIHSRLCCTLLGRVIQVHRLRSKGTRWRSWLRQSAISRKVVGSIPDDVTGIFHWHNPSDRTMALGLIQSLTKMSKR
jgi:hypothetical protein